MDSASSHHGTAHGAWQNRSDQISSPASHTAPPHPYTYGNSIYTSHSAISGVTHGHSVSEEASRASSSTQSSPRCAPSEDYTLLPNYGIKKVRLVMNPRSTSTNETFETPAMRLKARPKRPTLNLVLTEPATDHDSDDEDYMAPRSASMQTSRRSRDKQRSSPLHGSSQSGQPFHTGMRLPSNAFTVLCTLMLRSEFNTTKKYDIWPMKLFSDTACLFFSSLISFFEQN